MHERHALTLPLCRVPIIWPVQFYDDCEGLFAYEDSGDGADYDADYSATQAFVGNHSLHLQTKATAPAINDAVAAAKRLWLTPLNLLNLQFAFCSLTAAAAQIIVSLYWYDGTTVRTASIRFGGNPLTVEYLSSALGWTEITDATWKVGDPYWNYCSLLLDLAAGTWLPGVLNNVITFTDSPVLPSGASAVAPFLNLVFSVTTLAAARAGARFDQILLKPLNL